MPACNVVKTYGKNRNINQKNILPVSEASVVFDKLLAKNILKRKLSIHNESDCKRVKNCSDELPALSVPAPTILFSDDSLNVKINSTFDDLFKGPKYNSVKYNSGSLLMNASSMNGSSLYGSHSDKSKAVTKTRNVKTDSKKPARRKVKNKTQERTAMRTRRKSAKEAQETPQRKVRGRKKAKDAICIPKVLCESVNESLIIENEVKRNQALEFSKYLKPSNACSLHYNKSPELMNSLIVSGYGEHFFSTVVCYRMQAESTPKYQHSTPIVQRKFKNDPKIDSVSPINRKTLINRDTLKVTNFSQMLIANTSFKKPRTKRRLNVYSDPKLHCKAVVEIESSIDILGISAGLTVPQKPDSPPRKNSGTRQARTKKTRNAPVDKISPKVQKRKQTVSKETKPKKPTKPTKKTKQPTKPVRPPKQTQPTPTPPSIIELSDDTFEMENVDSLIVYEVDLKKWEDFSNSLFQANQILKAGTLPNKTEEPFLIDLTDYPETYDISSRISIDATNKSADLVLKTGHSWRRSLVMLRSRDNSASKDKVGRRWTSSFNEIRELNPLHCADKSEYDHRRITNKIVPVCNSRSSAGQRKTGYVSTASDDTVLEKLEKLSLDTQNRHQSARDLVLNCCGQIQPIRFDKCFTKKSLEKCRKIGEGVYGEVFMRKTETDQCLVMKIIPIEGSLEVNGQRQKKYEEIISEIIIASELSKLRASLENYTESFTEVVRVQCVQGRYPQTLIDLWELYDEQRGSENDNPEAFGDDQLYIVLELSNGGQDLEAYQFPTAEQTHSIFLQTACALAVAESALDFEHRDMHWGNVLISKTDASTVAFRLNGREFEVPTRGVKVTIIDFTLSRIKYESCLMYNDLAMDPELFTAKGDYQFEIYRLMRKRNNDDWQLFEPYSNILWLDYTLDKMLTQVHYNNKTTKTHKTYIRKLSQLKKKLLTFRSGMDFVSSDIFLGLVL